MSNISPARGARAFGISAHILSAAIASCVIPADAGAATRPAGRVESVACDQRYPGSCAAAQTSATKRARMTRKNARSSARHRDARAVRQAAARRGIVRNSQAGRINGIVGPLADKVRQIQSACGGARVVSGVRHTRVAGTRRMSLHAQGKAVDMAGNFRCIYAQLAGWPGGYTTDAHRVHHIHISYDREQRREWGLRFAHGGRARAARHRHAALRRGIVERATRNDWYGSAADVVAQP